MLSQKTRYAIRAMQHLADNFGQGPVQLADIAEAQKIPPKFLTVILSELSRSGLVASQRGKDGGGRLGVRERLGGGVSGMLRSVRHRRHGDGHGPSIAAALRPPMGPGRAPAGSR